MNEKNKCLSCWKDLPNGGLFCEKCVEKHNIDLPKLLLKIKNYGSDINE